jgi:hypothetical protein
MTTPPFTMVTGDYFTGLTRTGIIRYVQGHGLAEETAMVMQIGRKGDSLV